MIRYKKDKTQDPYYELWNREDWKQPLKRKGDIFPLIITVEPTNNCQNDCLYCSRQLMDRKTGLISLETMRAITKEASEHNSAIRYGGFGEPLLHKKIVDLIEINKKSDVLTTIFTNGQLLSEDMMRNFVDLGLDEIRFSSSGITPQAHEEIRLNSDYRRDFESKIEMASEIKNKMGAELPFLTVYTNVVDYDDDDVSKGLNDYNDKYLNFVDKVDIDLTMFSRVKELEHVKELYAKQTIQEEYKGCLTLFLKVIAHWNGDVFACDIPYNYEEEYYLGNLGDPEFTIMSGYNSDKINNLRKGLSFNLDHRSYSLCKDCYSNTNKWETFFEHE